MLTGRAYEFSPQRESYPWAGSCPKRLRPLPKLPPRTIHLWPVAGIDAYSARFQRSYLQLPP
jgi:hypothetical protein